MLKYFNCQSLKCKKCKVALERADVARLGGHGRAWAPSLGLDEVELLYGKVDLVQTGHLGRVLTFRHRDGHHVRVVGTARAEDLLDGGLLLVRERHIVASTGLAIVAEADVLDQQLDRVEVVLRAARDLKRTKSGVSCS